MKTFTIRLLSIIIFASFSSMLFWQYFAQRLLPEVKRNTANKVSPSPTNSNEVTKHTARKYSMVHRNSTPVAITQKSPIKVQESNAAVSNPAKVSQIPAKKKNDIVASNPDKVQQNPAKSNDVAVSEPLKVKPHPAKSNEAAASNPDKVQQNPAKSNEAAASNPDKVQQNPAKSKEISTIENLISKYTKTWTKQEESLKSFRSLLNSKCDAVSKAVVTQKNSPVGTNITFDADKRKLTVKLDLYNVFPKESPFKKAPWDSCAVVGNGGILANSSCGKQIDSASYVIRCNLPPLSNGHEKDTGNKTSLVTANPSIFMQRYQSLNERRKPFVNDMKLYGDAVLFVPAFSFGQNMAVSMRALYSLEELNSGGPHTVFINPSYLKSLADFWRGQGIKALRLSSGIMMTSLALEICNNVHLYGFWPFEIHPYTHQQITNHYYDNKPVNKRLHAMPVEFEALMGLHNKGVIHLHLGECTN